MREGHEEASGEALSLSISTRASAGRERGGIWQGVYEAVTELQQGVNIRILGGHHWQGWEYCGVCAAQLVGLMLTFSHGKEGRNREDR